MVPGKNCGPSLKRPKILEGPGKNCGPSLKRPKILEGPGEKLRTFLEKSQNPRRSREKTVDLP